MVHKTKDKGDLATIKTIADLTQKGYTIFIPVVCEHLPFDIIAYKDSKSYRIQSKYSSKGEINSKTSWSDKNGSHQKKYKDTDFDYYAIYLPQIDKIVYPNIKFMGASIRYTVPNAANAFYWYEDFLDFTDYAEKKTYKNFGFNITKEKCRGVPRFKNRKVVRPSKEELNKLLWEIPTSSIAKQFGVSDKAIQKWAKDYNLNKPPRGYWIKLKFAISQ